MADEKPQNGTDPGILNLAEAAAYLGISKSYLAKIAAGKVSGLPHLRCARVGRRILFRREWLDNWLEELAALGQNLRSDPIAKVQSLVTQER